MSKAYVFGFLIGLVICFASVALFLGLGFFETMFGFIIGSILLLISRR